MATSIPDDLYLVRYAGGGGAHVAGQRNGVLVHLCSDSVGPEGTIRHVGPIFDLNDPNAPAVECAHCVGLLGDKNANRGNRA